MAGSLTNKGRYKLLGWAFRSVTIPTNFYLALCSNDTPPTVDTNTMADVSEIAAGSGYTAGGVSLDPNATDFDVFSQDNTNDLGLIQIRDVVYTASGGSIPDSGNGARWGVLTDDAVTVSEREVFAFFDLVDDLSVTDGEAITIADATIRNKLA